MTVRSFRDLRAWQTTRAFKVSVYRLTTSGPLADDTRLRDQLRNAAASAASNIAEGFGRFEPIDNARFVRNARASLVECRNHLDDAVDRGHIDQQTHTELEAEITAAIIEVGGWLDYLQSSEAKENAARIRRERAERRRSRVNRTRNSEPRTRT